jgi:phage shock protein PspC (stress-responsive transcriptional regulator)
MNKILNINLGGYALTIDDDAYEYLKNYLEKIRLRFSEREGRDEILSDIEARLGEIITGSMGTRTIVMLPDVEAAATLMGKPEDFGTGEADSDTADRGTKDSGKAAVRTGKRLFRDEQDAIVAGVCSGLASYFGMTDPVWMRLIFVLLAFISFGFWVPAYILIWILVEPARSSSDRLAMRGEPINMDNIAKEVEDGFDRLGNRLENVGNDAQRSGKGASNAVHTGVSAIGRAFALLIKFVVKFAGLIAILVAIALFLGLASTWIAGIWAMFVAAPFVSYFSPFNNATTWLAFTNILFLIGIPVLGLGLLFTRIVFKTRTPVWASAGLSVLWILNLVSAIVLSSVGVQEYRREGSFIRRIELDNMGSDTLRVEGIRMNSTFDGDWRDFEGNISDIEFDNSVNIVVERSKSGRFECAQTITARGSSREKASEYAENIIFNISSEQNRLRIPTGFALSENGKWRAQRIEIVIAVPEGKYITFDEFTSDRVTAGSEGYSFRNDNNYLSREPNRTFTMTRDGILCTDCPKMGDRGYSPDKTYGEFIFDSGIEAEIIESEDFRIRFEGNPDKVETIESGDKITFKGKSGRSSDKVKVVIETPEFNSLYALSGSIVTIRGFNVFEGSIVARDGSIIKGVLDARDRLDIILSDGSIMDLSGKGGNLNATLSDGSILNANGWFAENARVSATDGSNAKIHSVNTPEISGDGSGKVENR